jgi:hypothetical protein
MLFETFCAQQHLDFEPIPTSAERTPDYRLQLGAATVLFEIEQIESLVGFEPDGVSSRTVGAHVRRKIADARKQVQAGSQSGLPAVLLIYNTVDSLQAFGTETHDFICAMYGELTVRLFNSRAHNTFHGRNATLRHDVNTSFSGVGHLRRTAHGAAVTIFENIYAANPLPFDAIPPCLGVVRVEVEHAA